MSLLLKNCISYGVLVIGLLVYCVCLSSYEFVESCIVMLLTILLWSALTTYLESFDTLTFSKVLSITGIIFAISFFFFFGVEEVPIPKGAMLFHAPGIAITLFIVLMSVLPMLYIIHGDKIPQLVNSQSLSSQPPITSDVNELANNDIDDNWEIATEEEAISGDFEIAA